MLMPREKVLQALQNIFMMNRSGIQGLVNSPQRIENTGTIAIDARALCLSVFERNGHYNEKQK